MSFRNYASMLVDYMKCSLENKIVFAGYGSIAAALILNYLAKEANINDASIPELLSGFSGTIALLATDFGGSTYEIYNRTRRHISRYGTIKSRFRDACSREYCTRKGMEMAAREANLESLL